MSDEKRRNARLQGRFSDEPKTSRKEKSKRKSDEGTSKRKSLEPKSLQPADGVEVQFDDQAGDKFSEYDEPKPPVEINKPGEHVLSETENGISRVIFEPDFLPKDEADDFMTCLSNTTQWYNKNIIIHGQEVPQPRLVAWYGPFPYSYSGAVLDAADMPPAVLKIKERIERYLETRELNVQLNSVLLNLYRDNKDSVAWHSDDELTMGVSPTIASVSLGEIRRFQMKIKHNALENAENLFSEEYFVNLTPGSLLIMDGSMQKDWKHQVPKEYHDRSPRINLTFRTVYKKDEIPVQVPLKIVENSNHPSSTKTEAKKHIFDNTNFPSLESANSQNGNNSKVLKNSSVKSKSKTVSDTASLSNQSYSESMLLNSSQDSSATEIQELKHSSMQHDESSDVVDDEHQTDEVKELNTNDECALPGTSESGQQASDNNQAGKRYELNADADEFIPKCPLPNDEPFDYQSSEYYKQPVIKFPDLFKGNKVPPSRYDEFFTVLVDKLECNVDFLTDRDHYEVETLAHLYDNGLSEKNQEIVLTRLCSMIKNATRIRYRSGVGGYRAAPSRNAYRNNYTRSRGPFNSRDKD